jgi:ABC-type multidrug transport system permease subunit
MYVIKIYVYFVHGFLVITIVIIPTYAIAFLGFGAYLRLTTLISKAVKDFFNCLMMDYSGYFFLVNIPLLGFWNWICNKKTNTETKNHVEYETKKLLIIVWAYNIHSLYILMHTSFLKKGKFRNGRTI